MDSRFQGSSESGKSEWLTPPSIIKAVGPFDLDPCSPINRPWDTAENHLTIDDDGLNSEWNGRVWCNPPYNRATIDSWMEKCADHGNCTALLFARTETKMFFDRIWERATAIFFIKGRLSFYNVVGTLSNSSAGAPSVLIAYDYDNAIAIRDSGIEGKLVWLKPRTTEGKRFVYIAHPIGGDVEGNIERVKKIIRAININEPDIIPIAHYVVDCESLNDSVPEERTRGLSNNLALLESGIFSEVRLHGDRVSEGMEGEIDAAIRNNIPVVPTTPELQFDLECYVGNKSATCDDHLEQGML